MKSTIKEFVYTKANGETAVRKVFVMNETDSHIQGFEINYLSKTAARKLKKLLANHSVHNNLATRANPSSTQIAGLNPDWIHSAWRTFKKSGIKNDVMTRKQLISYFVDNGYAKSRKAASNNISSVLLAKNGRKSAYGFKLSLGADGVVCLH